MLCRRFISYPKVRATYQEWDNLSIKVNSTDLEPDSNEVGEQNLRKGRSETIEIDEFCVASELEVSPDNRVLFYFAISSASGSATIS
jgi:hypothetical protein